MSCVFGVKITQTNGNFVFATAGPELRFTVAAPTLNPYRAGRLTAITYGATVVAVVPAFTGANELYEVGFLNNMATIDVVADNRP